VAIAQAHGGQIKKRCYWGCSVSNAALDWTCDNQNGRRKKSELTEITEQLLDVLGIHLEEEAGIGYYSRVKKRSGTALGGNSEGRERDDSR